MDIRFRPLEEADLPLMHKWLNQPHMAEFWSPYPISLDAVIAKYTPLIKKLELTHAHLAIQEAKPLGYIQSYKNSSWPEYANEIDLHEGVSIDFFIGQEFTGKRLGRDLLRGYLSNMLPILFPEENNYYICHNKSNEKANLCSQATGFKYIRDVIEKGTAMNLYKFDLALD